MAHSGCGLVLLGLQLLELSGAVGHLLGKLRSSIARLLEGAARLFQLLAGLRYGLFELLLACARLL